MRTCEGDRCHVHSVILNFSIAIHFRAIQLCTGAYGVPTFTLLYCPRHFRIISDHPRISDGNQNAIKRNSISIILRAHVTRIYDIILCTIRIYTSLRWNHYPRVRWCTHTGCTQRPYSIATRRYNIAVVLELFSSRSAWDAKKVFTEHWYPVLSILDRIDILYSVWIQTISSNKKKKKQNNNTILIGSTYLVVF
jgi:hypothetical protein